MDWETGKAVISAVSALVAVTGALAAQHARRQSRRDLFDAARDLLILTMAENDRRAEYLALHAGLLKERLSKLRSLPDAEEESERMGFLNAMTTAGAVGEPLAQREYTPDGLEKMEYSERALETLRRMARGEKVISESLTNEGYSLSFDVIKQFLEKHSGRAV